MQAPEDNSITVVEPQIEPYSDANLNEKNIGTQYIYTTEGELIPAGEDQNVDLNDQHFNTQSLHIEYQYEQQDCTVQQIVPELIRDEADTFVSAYAQASPEKEQHVGEPANQEATEENSPTEETPENVTQETPDSGHDLVIEEKLEIVEEEEETNENPKPEEVPATSLDSSEVDSAPKQPTEAMEEEILITVEEEMIGVEEQEQADVVESEESLVIVEEVDTQEQEIEVKIEKPSKPKGRKSTMEVPLHILGHDVNNPRDNVVNGKSPKPRPGVKVPYRNLTSQIVSKEEIENVIVERGRKKQEERQEQKFSRKLTSNLATKINNPESSPKKTKKMDTNGNQETQKIDHTDLLAILEGDGDASDEIPEFSGKMTKESSTTPTDESNLKNLEREIALQQLHDLPNLVPTPKTRFVGKLHKFKEPTGTASINLPFKSPVKTNQPQVKVNMALKTYSRKRKSTDAESTPSPKKTIVSTPVEIEEKTPTIKPAPTTYVTKSSRVIKKKVIWDPDEASIKIKPSPKAEAKPTPKADPKPTIIKTYSKEHPKNEYKSADLLETPTKKSADVPKKSAEVRRKSADVPKKLADVPKKSSDVTEKKAAVFQKPTPKKTPPAQVKRLSAVPKSATPKKPKSEVDRLLGDEGAIKMLYELQNSESLAEAKRRKTFSAEKTFKEARKKLGQIKLEVVNSTMEKTKNLRKKEPAILSIPGGISRQKSKDSSRSTPPPSPAFYPNETSYLIRRRSSDSISSTDDTESPEFDDTEERLSKKKPIATIKDPLEVKKPKKTYEPVKPQKRAENKLGHYNNFDLKKTNKAVTIDFYTDDNQDNYFTLELLTELTSALNKISKEKDCNVVLIRSSNPGIFSNGMDYTELISDKPKSIRQAAEKVQNFLQCLLDFPKILVAGIQGECVGLAVTMLPLFDVVIASDDARFSLPYSKLGCAAEGGFLLGVPYMANNGLAGDLLYASQKLTADEAHRRGLISKLCWPEKYQDTVKGTVAAAAQGSRQGLEANKRQLRAAIRSDCEEAIISMSDDLVEHWKSKECQSSFAQL